MCGIIGANRFYKNFLDSLNIMDKRGPDNSSVYNIDNNYFGHTRLSIIDLDKEANQPMVFDDIVIVFNGEIYNYKELIKEYNLQCVTSSDTEVLIRLYLRYGIKMLNKLNGAFAFCIYDIKQNRYFCARDRYGKKPFYYYFKDNKFIFSSMIKPIIALLGSTPNLNKVALSQYLQFFTPLAPNTFYQDIFKLPSGSYMIFENNQLSIKKYYKIDFRKTIFSEDEAVKQIEQTLLKSVELRLISDVEVGSLLSGGIDSSLISSMYSKLTNHKINTFSIGYKDHTKYSELPYAKTVSKYINSNHTQIELTKSNFIDSLDEVFSTMEEPHGDPAAIPLYHLSKTIHNQGIKTVLSGEGSDEIFLGYDNYSKFYQYYQFKQSLTSTQQQFLKQNIFNSKTTTKEMEYLKRVLNNDMIYNSFAEVFTYNQKKLLFKKLPTFKYEIEKKNCVDWMSYIDLKVWLGEALLSKVDKILMANSVENRNPFLDYHLVNLSFKIDSKLKLGDTNKYLLKKVASKYIPQEIINRQKKGFNSPYNEWLFEEYKDNLLQTILKANQKHNLFNEEYIYIIYNQAKNNKFKQHFYLLWNFSRWYLCNIAKN